MTNQPKKKLADILQVNADIDSLEKQWEQTVAAAEFTVLPAATYLCRVLSGELFNATKGTPGYKLVFEVTEGEYADRRIWHDFWLTPQALPMSKRDLAKLGVTSLKQLERPLPAGILVKVKVTVRPKDDGTEYNHVRSFEAVGIEPGDAFGPPEDANADTTFDPARLEAESAKNTPAAARQKEPATLFGSNGQTGTGPYLGDRR